MNDRVNKTSICSIVFLDIIDYSKKSDSDQINVKIKFNDLISRSLKSVAQNDRIILDTGDGVAIALMGSPEDAMFVALTIRDGILKSNEQNTIPLYVRFGINLGPVRTVNDINNQPNILGDGINVAQRIMSFAEPNQILVSRSYYEVTSRLTEEFSEMFDYFGVKQDKHVREHEVYSVRSHKEQEAPKISEFVTSKDSIQILKPSIIPHAINWKYAAPGIFAVASLLGFAAFMPMKSEAIAPNVVFKNEAKVNPTDHNKMVKVALIPEVEINKATLPGLNVLPEINETPAKAVDPIIQEVKKDESLTQEKVIEDKTAEEKKLAKAKLAAKKAKQKAAKEKAAIEKAESMQIEHVATTNVTPTRSEVRPTEHKKPEAVVAANTSSKDKSGFAVFAESFKQGKKNECTQVQISMNQCH